MKGKNKKLLLVFIIICFVSLIFGTCKVLSWNSDNKENDETQKELIEIIDDSTQKKSSIDFEKLKNRNSDTVGYLKVNNTNINYVVVKGKDNSYYLSHNFNKKPNVAGWVFADYHNKFDGTDRNIVIYGHNMKSGSMFGTLKYVLKKEWYKNTNNHKILFSDETGDHYYQVFSTYTIKVEDYYINTEFDNDKDFYTFIKTLKNRSKYKYNVTLKETDKILTLSTCSAGGTKRVVVHAKLIED